MHGFCNCSVGASVFFLHDPSKSNKTNNVSYVNGDHESTHFYEVLPSCISKNTSSNVSKRPPAVFSLWVVSQLGDCDHCRRDVFGPYILVWRGRMRKTRNVSKMLDHYFFGTVLGSSTWLFFSRTYFEDCRLPSRDLPGKFHRHSIRVNHFF